MTIKSSNYGLTSACHSHSLSRKYDSGAENWTGALDSFLSECATLLIMAAIINIMKSYGSVLPHTLQGHTMESLMVCNTYQNMLSGCRQSCVCCGAYGGFSRMDYIWQGITLPKGGKALKTHQRTPTW